MDHFPPGQYQRLPAGARRGYVLGGARHQLQQKREIHARDMRKNTALHQLGHQIERRPQLQVCQNDDVAACQKIVQLLQNGRSRIRYARLRVDGHGFDFCIAEGLLARTGDHRACGISV